MLTKVVTEYTTYFEGLAGHSSMPHKGVSAVEYATRYANKLIELREELKKGFLKILFLIHLFQLYKLEVSLVELLIMLLLINVI